MGPLMISEAEPAANSRAANFSAVINGEDRLLARLFAILTIGISVSVLFGWAFSVEPLKTIWPGGAQMKANTASGLVMAGLSLLLATLPDNLRRWQAALGIIVSLFGALFLLEYSTGRELGVDNLLFHDPSDFLPGRPSVSTSLSFVAVGIALALMRVGSSVAQALRSTLAVCGIVLALTALLGYFVTPVDSSVRHILFGFAIHTAASFLLLSIGVLAAGSRRIETNRFLHLGAPIGRPGCVGQPCRDVPGQCRSAETQSGQDQPRDCGRQRPDALPEFAARCHREIAWLPPHG